MTGQKTIRLLSLPIKCLSLSLPVVASLTLFFSPQAGAQNGKTTASPQSSNKWAVVVGVSKFKDLKITGNAEHFGELLSP